MAHSVTGASLDGIYSRLNGAPQYHPLDAQTFADWTVEAGDVVRFQRGNVNYDSPVHSTKVVWRGTPQVTVSSTGAKEREPVSKVSRKKYGRGGNAVRSEERIYHEFTSEDGLLHSAISISAAELTTEFQNADAGLASQIQFTAEQLTTNFEAADGLLSSRIIENATSISAEVSNRENADVELRGSLEILSDKASLVVSATDTRQVKTYLRKSDFPATGSTSYLYYDLTDQKYYEWTNNQYVQTTPGNTINRAGIIATINNDGSSTTNILGDKIIIGELDDEDLDSWAADAKHGRGTFAKYLTVRTLTAQELNTMLADIGDATIDDLHVGTIDVEILTVEEGITVPSINDCLIGDFIADASISGTTLTLTDVEGETVTISKSLDGKTLTFTDSNGGSFDFNKAASVDSLTGNWSGSILTVTTNPSIQGVDYTVGFGSQTANQKLAVDIDRTTPPEVIAGTTNIRVPLRVYTQGTSQYDPDVNRYTTTAALNMSSLLQNRTSTQKITQNGSYTPDPGYIGFSSVEVEVSGASVISGLTGTWSNNVLSVKTNPDTGYNYTVGFGGQYNAHNTEFQVAPNGTPTVASAVALSVPVKVQSLNGSGDPTVRHTTTVTANISTLLQDKTGTNKITQNGTYSPDTNYIGLSSVQVAVPTYAEGWTAAYNSVDGHYPTSVSTNNYISVPKPNSTVDGTVQYMNYYIDDDTDGVFIRYGSVSGTKVAKANITYKSAETYYTSTSTQTIASNQYLTGAQSIAAVYTSGIDAGNIKSGTTIKVGDSGNNGRIKNITGTFTSDGTAVAGDILSGKIAYVNGSKITGTISSKAAATYYTSTSTQTIASGQYLSGAQSIAAVSTSNIDAGNIKNGVVVKVGDSGNTGRIINVTGTFTSDATAAAGDILSGKTAYVGGIKITGTLNPSASYESWFNNGRDAVAPCITSSQITRGSSDNTYNGNVWSGRVQSITANGTYYLNARGKFYSNGSPYYGPFISNDFTNRAFTVNVSGGGGSISITADSPLSAAAGQSAVDSYISNCVRIYSSTNINKDGNYSKYYRFTVKAGSSSKKYYFRT